MASINAILAGVTASVILITGYLTAMGLFYRGKKDKNTLLIWAGFFLACMGSFYLGTVLSFISLLIKGENLPSPLVGGLCYTWAPLGCSISMYVGFTMIKKNLAKPMTIIFLITAPVYFYGLWFMSAETIGFVIPDEVGGGLIDINLLGFIKLMTMVYLISFAVILIPGFTWLAKKSSGTIRDKALMHVLGYTLFLICGAIDSLFAFASWIGVVRLFMALAYIFLYKGFTKMK